MKFLLGVRSLPAARIGWLLLAALLLHLLPLTSVAADRPFTEQVTSFLKKVVTADGQVNYGAASRETPALQALLRQVQTYDAAAATAASRKAFYLNAYNLVVIKAVVDAYPVTSVMKLPGFFDKQLYTVAGEKTTLNDLETNKLRKPYADPRIHFALVCGAKGCPRLRPEAYAAATLDAQLTDQTRKVLQDPQFIRVGSGGKVLVSEIFKWYDTDFKATGKSTLAYINQYRGRQLLPATASLDYYPYDWALNDRKTR